MHSDLHRSVAIHNELRERIKIAYALDDDDQTLADTLEGATDLTDDIANVIREARKAEANALAMDTIIEANRLRKALWEKRRETLRDLAAWAMAEGGLSKVTTPDLTLSLRPGKPRVVIVEEGSLSAEFVKTITTTKPDLALIKASVDRGDVPDGVRIDNGAPVLTVRAG